MAGAKRGRRRSRGSIERQPNGALKVSVYAGYDPITGKRHYLRETVPAGPQAEAQAEKIRIRSPDRQCGQVFESSAQQ